MLTQELSTVSLYSQAKPMLFAFTIDLIHKPLPYTLHAHIFLQLQVSVSRTSNQRIAWTNLCQRTAQLACRRSRISPRARWTRSAGPEWRLHQWNDSRPAPSWLDCKTQWEVQCHDPMHCKQLPVTNCKPCGIIRPTLLKHAASVLPT